MVEQLRQFLQTYLNLSVATQNRLFVSLVILLALWLIRLLAMRFLHQRFEGNPKAQYNWRKVVQYSTVILGIFLIGRVWLEGIQSLATYLGLLSAGIAIALQDLLINLAGWGYIVWQRPFKVGDRIEIGDSAGDVIDVSLLEFTLLEIGNRIDADQSTGRLIHIPNGLVFKEPLVNAHQGIPFIWHEIPVLVTFESDWEKAKRLLLSIIRHYAPDPTAAIDAYRQRADKRFVISYANVKPTVYTSVASSGVLLTVRYLVDPRKQRSSEQTIWEAILKAFAPHWDIDFAYDTTREYIHWREGKRPPQPDKPDTHRGLPIHGQATDTQTRLRVTRPPTPKDDTDADD
ncbi:MAG: mechanosensitive ion channel family protein [Anaerolineales bacterium]|nr:mechanosensitive ion channel family protein [Anaerolineales bacterium]